ncbi:putative CCR4-associated factor 1 homolog 8 [Wolffia australiana]
MAGAKARGVWASNLHQEFPLMMQALGESRFVAVDTKFAGFVRHISSSAGSHELYEDDRRNVNGTKIIQLGLSFFDAHGRSRTWEINFRDFDLLSPSDLRWPPAINLLKHIGIDFVRTREEGVDSEDFAGLLRRSKRWTRGPKPLWVTFQGFYDVAYLLKLLTGALLPRSLEGFARLARRRLGRIVDVKCLLRVFRVSPLPLARISHSLGVPAFVGAVLQTGVASLLSGMVYGEIAAQLGGLEKGVEGILCGRKDETIVVPLLRKKRAQRAAAQVVRPPRHVHGGGRAPLSPRMVASYTLPPPRVAGFSRPNQTLI